MIKRILSGFAVLALAGFAPAAMAYEATPATGAPPSRIATADLAQLPEFSDAKLSPDGLRILFRRRAGGVEYVAYRDATGGKISGFAVPEQVDLNWSRWAGNGHILASVGRNTLFMGVEAYKSILLLHDVASGATSVISREGQGLEGDDILFVDPEGRYLLLSIQRSIYDYP